MSMVARRRWLASAIVLGPLALSACPPSDPPNEVVVTPGCDEQFRTSLLTLNHNRDVDILFVIDNSASMARAQIQLVEAAGALFERLDAAGLNYRIAFTTTDAGNPWCPDTTPERGGFVLASCESRLACDDLCTLDAAALTVRPTSVFGDPTVAARPWIERIEGLTNLPETTDMLEAFRCFAPQGIDGCGFESPLESMYLALERAQTPEAPEFGFLRIDAALAVVVLTDEDDCSYDEAWADIFSVDGNKLYWSDPSAPAPSSAVCWNAGVTCTGDPSGYDSCEPAEKTIDGEPPEEWTDAVLHSLDHRYVDQLDDLESAKQDYNASRELVFTLIGGVEGGGENWSVTYADAQDPAYQLEFGIGPGCTTDAGETAVPPVRMRALAETIDPLGLYSICDASFEDAMVALGDRITAQFPPLCSHHCVSDADPSTSQLEPNCSITQYSSGPDAPEVALPECERGEDGAYRIDAETSTYQLPATADACFVTLVDADGSQTLDANDNLSQACVDYGSNVEFVIVRRRGVPAPEGAALVPDCTVSACPDVDCPGIGG